MSKAELACVYASLLLADDEVDITADKINTVLKSANIKFVEPYLPGLFANTLHGKNVKDLLMSIGSAGPAVAASGAAPAAAAEAAPAAKAKEEKKEESEADSDESMGFDLFG